MQPLPYPKVPTSSICLLSYVTREPIRYIDRITQSGAKPYTPAALERRPNSKTALPKKDHQSFRARPAFPPYVLDCATFSTGRFNVWQSLAKIYCAVVSCTTRSNYSLEMCFLLSAKMQSALAPTEKRLQFFISLRNLI